MMMKVTGMKGPSTEISLLFGDQPDGPLFRYETGGPGWRLEQPRKGLQAGEQGQRDARFAEHSPRFSAGPLGGPVRDDR